MLIVQLCDFGNDGDAEYRLHEPSRQLGRAGDVSIIDCHFAHRRVPELADRADVLIVQFINDWELLSRCMARRAAGKVTVFEANDYFFDLQPWNPIAAGWRDRTVQELYRQLLVHADGVQTSSESLAERWRRFGAREIAVFRNHLPQIEPLPATPRRPITIGWAGSPGHFADWFAVVPHLSAWLERHPNTHLAVMCNELARGFFSLPASRYQFTPFGSLQDYLRFLTTLDIGLAPLLPTEYNRCRSDVKFLEYASQGVVGIYADLDPYRSSVIHGETGLIYQTPNEMIACLDLLLENEELRHRLRSNAHQYVAKNRLIGPNIGERLEWYRQLIAKVTEDPNLPVKVSPEPAGYQALRAEVPETKLIEVQQGLSLNEAMSVLKEVLELDPQYLTALQLQARLKNDQRQHRDAFACLERAMSIAPGNTRTLNELGRTLYLLDDLPKARAALDAAIQINPQYLPAWQYLLRLLTITKSPDAMRYAVMAAERFPTCYPLILPSLDAYPASTAIQVVWDLLERTAPTLTVVERPIALSAFRQAIVSVVARSAGDTNRPVDDKKADDAITVAMLRRACEVFPDSPKLAGELGQALLRTGDADKAVRQMARGLSLHQQAAADREEFASDSQIPWEWYFAKQIESGRGPGEVVA